jgi:hypothetical protein
LKKDSYIIYIGNWSRITEVPCHSSLEDVLVRFRGNVHRAEKRRQEKSGCNLPTVKKKNKGPRREGTGHRVGRVLSVSPVVGIGTPPPL